MNKCLKIIAIMFAIFAVFSLTNCGKNIGIVEMNYHFEEEVRDGDVFFNYELKEGKARTRNAIKLLSVMGYETNIIDKAENMAENFIRDGVWA